MKSCKYRNCSTELYGRKKYCSENCKYRENRLKKDDEQGMMPKRKRNKDWFWSYAGASYERGQGKRVGHMIKGGLSGSPSPKYIIKESNKSNLDTHFNNPCVYIATFGDSSYITKDMYEESFYPNKDE